VVNLASSPWLESLKVRGSTDGEGKEGRKDLRLINFGKIYPSPVDHDSPHFYVSRALEARPAALFLSSTFTTPRRTSV
jgi:hypothetical protein